MEAAARENMIASIPVIPYISMEQQSRNWQGISAISIQLAVPSRDFLDVAAPLYWPQTTIIYVVAAKPQALLMQNGRDWRKSVVHAGELLFAPVNEARRFVWTEVATNLSMSLDDKLIAAVTSEMVKGDPAQISFRPLGHFIDPFLAQVGYSIYGLLSNSAADARLYAESLGVTLTHHLLYHHAKRQRSGVIPHELAHVGLKRVLEYIHMHYHQDLSLQGLADQCGMSIAHFSRLFRQATERSPYQYLIQLRCEKACELLASGQYTVTEAAHAVGFFDHSHFIRHFKRQYHVTPSEWLKNQSHKGFYFDLAGRDDG